MDTRSTAACMPGPSDLTDDALGLRRLYTGVLRTRDGLVVLLAVVSLLLPTADKRRLLVAGALILVVLPYNLALRRGFDRTGHVPGVMAWGDQVLITGFLVLWPALTAPGMVLGLLDVAVAAVMLDRRAATRGAAVGGVLVAGTVLLAFLTVEATSPTTALSAPSYALSAITTAWMVGTVAGRERRGSRKLTSLLESLRVVIYEMDAETLEVRYVSPHITDHTGRPPGDFLGDPTEFLGLVHRRDQELLLSMVTDLSGGSQSHDREYRVFAADGSQRWVRNIASNELGPDGRRLLRGSISDITAQKEAEAALAHSACTDGLTGLPNRTRLLEELGQVLLGTTPYLLVFLDVDAFKRINDSLGHGAGDALLVQIARRFGDVLRDTDRVARLGGDEFVVLAHLADPADAETVVRRVLATFAAPFALDGRSVRVTASAGAVVVPDTADEPAEAVLQCADAAMYAAKRSGPGRFSFYDEGLRAAALERLDVESELREALAQEQFSLVYQPIVRASGHEVVGHEALLRWTHPVRGVVSPAEFVPIAEQTGQVVDIGRWVLREACRQAASWSRETGRELRMSVNLSGVQLSDPDLVEDVAAALRDAGLPPSSLCLEITETAIIDNPAEALVALRELRAAGVALALDDFGTGYSSLSHLYTYPVDTVKIDRSFVAAMDDSGAGIVSAILHLAEHMQLTVVAEGVETPEQADALRALGCDLLQGYALGRPAPAHPVPLPRLTADVRASTG